MFQASPMAQHVKNPPAMRKTQEMHVQFLGWKDPLEKEMETHSVFLPGKSHGEKSLVGFSPKGCEESDSTGD